MYRNMYALVLLGDVEGSNLFVKKNLYKPTKNMDDGKCC
jgi:hypothetical protein